MSSLYRRFLVCIALALLPARLAAQQVTPGTGGDFRVGDRVLLTVEGEPPLTDTFTVVAGPALELPVIGRVSLVGISHADLQQYMTTTIGRYVRNPTVTVRSLVRIGVLGQVQRPGFYSVPAQGMVSDALMAAGGPTNTAKLDKATVLRDDSTAISSDSLSHGLAAGLTLAQLGLLSGDQIVVPAERDWQRTAQIIGILIAVPATIITLFRIL